MIDPLNPVAVGDPHATAHNDERTAVNDILDMLRSVITFSDAAPDPTEAVYWIDSSTVPPTARAWNGSDWVENTATDGRIQYIAGRVFGIADPWDPSNPDRRLLVEWDESGPHIVNANFILPVNTTFSKVPKNPNIQHGFGDVNGRWMQVFRGDGQYHTREPGRPLVIIGDSQAGVGPVKNADPKLAIALRRPIFNFAISGDRQEWLDARTGGRPSKAKITSHRATAANTGYIPSTGEVSIQLNVQLGANVQAFWGMLGSVAGLFTPIEDPGSPDPRAANDPGSIGFNYIKGTFFRYDQGGMPVVIEDNTPLITGYLAQQRLFLQRAWWMIQPSRHSFTERYQNLPMGGVAGNVVFAVGSKILPPVAWDPAGLALTSVTFTAANDRATFTAPHPLIPGQIVTFSGVTGATGIISGKPYIVQSVPTTTSVTLVGPNPLNNGVLDISTDGTATGSVKSAESVFSTNLAAVMVTVFGAGWTGTIDPLTNTSSSTVSGLSRVNWGSADIPNLFTVVQLDAGVTCQPGHLRSGLEDTVTGVYSILDAMTNDAYMHSFVSDMTPWPTETAGSIQRALLDATNGTIADAFGDKYFGLHSAMRNVDLINRVVAGTPLEGIAPTTADLDAINITKTIPPTFTDVGGYTPSGSSSGAHLGPVGADARILLLSDRQGAMPRRWEERA